MLLQSIGAGLPAALAVTLSPFPVIGVVVMLSSPHGRRKGLLFAAGWIVGLALVAALVVLVFGTADDPDSVAAATVDWGRVIAGAALIALGVRKWAKRSTATETEPPRWMRSLTDASAPMATGLGLLLSAANPKNFVLTAAATTSMVEVGAHGSDLFLGVVVFVLVGSITVVGAVVVQLVGGDRGAALLESVRRFMIANGDVITTVVLLILGAKVLGDGLGGIGR